MSPLLTAHCADGDTAEALADHRPGAGWLYSSPRGGIVASGPARWIPGPTHVARALADARADGHPDPVAIGAADRRGWSAGPRPAERNRPSFPGTAGASVGG